jgi:hypothetical protein
VVGLTKVASRPARKLSRKLWRAGTGTCPRSCKALVPSQRPASVTVKPTYQAESRDWIVTVPPAGTCNESCEVARLRRDWDLRQERMLLNRAEVGLPVDAKLGKQQGAAKLRNHSTRPRQAASFRPSLSIQHRDVGSRLASLAVHGMPTRRTRSWKRGADLSGSHHSSVFTYSRCQVESLAAALYTAGGTIKGAGDSRRGIRRR